VALVLAAAALTQAGVIPRVGTGDGTEQTVQATKPHPGVHLAALPKALPVLGSAEVQSPATAVELRAQLATALAQKGFGPRLGVAVGELYGSGSTFSAGPAVLMPASTLKLLTTTAALSLLGPGHRFTTSVVEGARPDGIVLVGGGDPLLVATPSAGTAGYPTPATLADLAHRTARRLAEQGKVTVHLSYDTSLFSGPAVSPHWPKDYVPENVVSPITSLWVNEGRENPGLALRSADPAAAAAEAFRTLLDKAGVKVVGPIRRQTRTPVPQTLVAAVESPTLAQIVEHVLEDSDNEGAEVLLRQVAIASGLPGSFAAGVKAVRATLTGLGLDLGDAVIYDGSGLSRDDRLPASDLVQVLQLDASPAHPELRGVISGLPVAGFTGTMAYRLVDDDADDGLGYVRAKTGTLTGVHALAGLVTTRQGNVLVFVAIADRVPYPKTLEARADLDRIGSALSACEC
jgi:D-alanyl-D-alanine carboxypeptidase/D-alanyl-D-alanine-endopeptidase (penicillin-binding protein 4)